MNNEDFERATDFILRKQAQFDAKMDRFDASLQSLKDSDLELRAFINQKLAQTADNLALASVVMVKLAESQALTDEKLRDLTATVDRHTGDRHKHDKN